MLFAAQVRPVLQEEPFKWDVALVEAVKTDSVPDQTPAPQPVVPPVQAQARATAPRPVEPPPDAVMHRVAPQQTVQMVHPEVQPPKPVEQREDPVQPLKTEPVTPTKEAEPIQSAEPVIAQRQPVEAPPSEAVETKPIEAPAKPSVPEPVASSSPVDPAPAVSPNPVEVPVQTAKAAPSGSEVKTDHRWLAESLWRRVAELKRYPSSARLNGQEGKVILKAVIRSDGHLAEVSVQKSSGHHILDVAAMEAVKLACPLHMKHAIGKPEIVVSLPIVYSLAN